MTQDDLLERIKNKEDKIKEFGDILDSCFSYSIWSSIKYLISQ